MNPAWVTAILAGLALLGQGVNAYLFQRLRGDLLEMEQRVMDRVAATYKRQDVCESDMRGFTPVAKNVS